MAPRRSQQEQPFYVSLEQAGGEVSLLAGSSTRLVVHRPTVFVIDRQYARCDNDSALLVPGPWSEGRHPLAAVVVAASMLRNSPQGRLLVVGRASAAGSAKHNQALSEARADGVRALFDGDEAAWVDIASEHGSLRDVLAYLEYLGSRRGWGCLPELVVAEHGTTSTAPAKQAVERFQAEYNERFDASIDIDGVCGSQTLGAVFSVLRFELERWLDKFGSSPDELPLDRVSYHGVGADFVDAPQLDASTDADHRIVDLLLVEPVADEQSFDLERVYLEPLAIRQPSPVPEQPDEWASGPLTIVTDLTPNEAFEPETYCFGSEDGSFAVECIVPDDATVDAGEYVLRFEALPTDMTYSLTVRTADGRRHPVFSAVPYGAFHRPRQETT